MSKNEIGKRLKNARLNRHFTQAEVAKRLGCTYQAISNYERGTSRIDSNTLFRLCEIYGITPIDLMRTPMWDDSMLSDYHKAKTDVEKMRYFDMWGVPAELMADYNELVEPEEIAPGEQALTEGEKTLLELFRKIPSDQQEMVLQMIRAALNAAK